MPPPVTQRRGPPLLPSAAPGSRKRPVGRLASGAGCVGPGPVGRAGRGEKRAGRAGGRPRPRGSRYPGPPALGRKGFGSPGRRRRGLPGSLEGRGGHGGAGRPRSGPVWGEACGLGGCGPGAARPSGSGTNGAGSHQLSAREGCPAAEALPAGGAAQEPRRGRRRRRRLQPPRRALLRALSAGPVRAARLGSPERRAGGGEGKRELEGRKLPS